MPSNGKEYQTIYMKKYITNAEQIHCETCGGKYKTYSKYRHMRTKKHMNAEHNNVSKSELQTLTEKVDQISKILDAKLN
jgi:hypothetical protein